MRSILRTALVAALGATVGALSFAGAAQAARFTLDSAIVIDGSNDGGSGVRATILPISDPTGSIITLDGSITNAVDQDWFVVQIVMDGISAVIDQIEIGVPGVPGVLGVGHYSDPDETPTGGAVAGTAGQFDYDFNNIPSAANLEQGETSDRLIVSFTAGDLPGPGIPPIFAPGTASFMISSGADFSVEGNIVPEPGTGALVISGFAGLLLLNRSGRRYRA